MSQGLAHVGPIHIGCRALLGGREQAVAYAQSTDAK